MTEQELEQLRQLIPLLIPVILIQFGLMLVALVDLVKRPKTRGPKWVWVVVVVLINVIGPIIYFVVGREEE